jgi:hypothetical protein
LARRSRKSKVATQSQNGETGHKQITALRKQLTTALDSQKGQPMIEVAIPVLHELGTDPGELAVRFYQAYEAVADALAKLHLAFPAGCDYDGTDTIDRALYQHSTRMDRLFDVLRELEAILDGIKGQMH